MYRKCNEVFVLSFCFVDKTVIFFTSSVNEFNFIIFFIFFKPAFLAHDASLMHFRHIFSQEGNFTIKIIKKQPKTF